MLTSEQPSEAKSGPLNRLGLFATLFTTPEPQAVLRVP
jgi:hypothetical protein